MDAPPTSLESDVICPKSRGESEFSFFNCTIRKPSNAGAPRCPVVPGEGIAKWLTSIPVYLCAPGKLPRKAFSETPDACLQPILCLSVKHA